MTTESDLLCVNKILKEDAERVMAALDPKDFPNDAINWGDLNVLDVLVCRSLTEGVFYEILIDEVAPDAMEFQNAILAKLQKYAFPVRIRTEW